MKVLAGIHDPATIYTHNGGNKMKTLITENGIKITAKKKFTVNFFPEQLEVTPEQLRRCIRVMPWEASKYYCEEETK